MFLQLLKSKGDNKMKILVIAALLALVWGASTILYAGDFFPHTFKRIDLCGRRS
jgi:hypothetical protein